MRLNADGIAKFKVLENKTDSARVFPFRVMVGNLKIYMGNIFQKYSSYTPGDLPYIFTPVVNNLKISRVPDRSIRVTRDEPRVYNALDRKDKLKEGEPIKIEKWKSNSVSQV
jgi:hypothetical protein